MHVSEDKLWRHRTLPAFNAAHMFSALLHTVTYHVVDASEWRVVCNGFKRWPGSIPIRGGCHFPAELDWRLVDSSFITALLHDGVLGEVQIARRYTDQWIAWWRGFLHTLFGHFLHMVIVCQGNHLQGCKTAEFTWETKLKVLGAL